MKNSYDDIDELLNDIKSDIEEVLMDEVLDEVKDIELRHIEDDVFSVYSPKIYDRRRSGGIDDPDNIVGEVNNMRLSVENVTHFDDGYGTYNHGIGLADLINDGDGKSGYYYDYPFEAMGARPFIDNAIEEIERTNDVENALERGLKRRKYDVS